MTLVLPPPDGRIEKQPAKNNAVAIAKTILDVDPKVFIVLLLFLTPLLGRGPANPVAKQVAENNGILSATESAFPKNTIRRQAALCLDMDQHKHTDSEGKKPSTPFVSNN